MLLVIGGSQYVGRALLASYLTTGARGGLRTLVSREFDALRWRDLGVDAVTGDPVAGRGLDEAMRGVDTVIYAYDTADRPGDLLHNELEAVQRSLITARAARVRRVVVHSNVATAEHTTSEFLLARWAVELAVQQSELPWTLLRSSLVIGAGSPLWEALHRVADRSPVVPLFRWRRTEVEPVALADVVAAIRDAVDRDDRSERSFAVTGATRTTVGDTLRRWVASRGRRRLFVPLPGWGEVPMRRVADTVAGAHRREMSRLLPTLRERMVCADPSDRYPLDRRPLSLEAAMQEYLDQRSVR